MQCVLSAITVDLRFIFFSHKVKKFFNKQNIKINYKSEVNLSELGARRKDIGNDHDSRRRDNRNDRDVRRRDNSNDHGDRSRDFEKLIHERRRDNDPTGKDDRHHRGEQGDDHYILL